MSRRKRHINGSEPPIDPPEAYEEGEEDSEDENSYGGFDDDDRDYSEWED